MDRRNFIKLTVISGTSATVPGCGSPEHVLVRFVPEEQIVPGLAQWKRSVCPLCGSGCGLDVRVMPADVETARDGEPGVVRRGVAKKLEGNPAHPVNRGRLCARGQAGLQVTYHPDRITQPLKRSGSRGDRRFDLISWDEAIGTLVSRLDALASAGDRQALAMLTNARRDHRQMLFERFAEAFGAPAPVTHALFEEDVLRRANALSFGREQLPTADLAHARFVLNFGADFLGTWNSPVAQSAAFGDMRQHRAGVRGALVQVESRMTLTGASADEWLAVRPGTEGVLALGIAHLALKQGQTAADAASAGARLEGWREGLPDYTPERVEQVTGVSATRVVRLARQFLETRPSVAMVGGPPLAHTNGLFTALAVNALNAVAGSVGTPGGVFFTPRVLLPRRAPGGPQRRSLPAFAAALRSGGGVPQILFVDGTNPLYSAPRAWGIREALERVPFIVSFASFIDETSVLADLVLPDHTFLESWTDAMPETGSRLAVASVAAPVMRPLFETRATPDVLLHVGRSLAAPLGLPWQTFDELLRTSFGALGEGAWATALEQGGWWGDAPGEGGTPSGDPVRETPVAPYRFAEPQFAGEAATYPLHFLPYPSHAFLDGSLAHLPWLQELPDPMTSAMWSTWIEINTTTAGRLGIGLGDLVEVISPVGTLRAPAFLSPAIAPDVVAMPVGQGHESFTRYASGRGANPLDIVAPLTQADTDSLAWAGTRIRLTRVSGPDGRLILFSAGGELRERPHEQTKR